MGHIGIDVQTRVSQLCILSDGAELIEPRVLTSRQSLANHGAQGPDSDRGVH